MIIVRSKKRKTIRTVTNSVTHCPFCGSANLQKFDELNNGIGRENLSEKELSDYLAGKWGTFICKDCGLAIDYQNQ